MQETIGNTPYEVLFGQQMRLPVDIALLGDSLPQKLEQNYQMLREDLGVGNEDLVAQAFNEARTRTRTMLRTQAAKRLELAQEAQRKRWNERARELNLQPGAKAHVRTERGDSKAKAKKARLDW